MNYIRSRELKVARTEFVLPVSFCVLSLQPSPNAGRQWLADFPAGKRALLEAENGVLFLRFVTALDAALGLQLLAIEEWHTRRRGPGQDTPRQQEATELADMGTAIDYCSEILKTTASLLSMTT